MAVRSSSYTIEIGDIQDIELAQGEDREFRFAITVNGLPLDMTGATSCVMRACNRSNKFLTFAIPYTGFIDGDPTTGTPIFLIAQADTNGQAANDYDWDLSWTDANLRKTQLVAMSLLTMKARFS